MEMMHSLSPSRSILTTLETRDLPAHDASVSGHGQANDSCHAVASAAEQCSGIHLHDLDSDLDQDAVEYGGDKHAQDAEAAEEHDVSRPCDGLAREFCPYQRAAVEAGGQAKKNT